MTPNRLSIALALTCGTLLCCFSQGPKAVDLSEIAGTYYQGDGLGVNWTLTVDSQGRFSFTWDACMGRVDDNFGDAEIDDGVLLLHPQKPLEHGKLRRLPVRLLPVRWAERLYLVDDESMPLFAEYINRAKEPRSHAQGMFFLRQEDWRTKSSGYPNLPSRWERFLLPRPVNARIVKLANDHLAEIDKGSADGLQVGMFLTAVAENEWIRVTVRSVNKDSSVVEAQAEHLLMMDYLVTSRP